MILSSEATGVAGHPFLQTVSGTIKTRVRQGSGGAELGSVASVQLAKGGTLTSVTAPGRELAMVVLTGAGDLRAGDAHFVVKPWHCVFSVTDAIELVADEGLEALVIVSNPTLGAAGHAIARMFNILEVTDHPFHLPEQGFYHLSARWLIDGTIGSEQLVLGQSTFVQSDSSHELHRHDHAEEFFFVLEGGGVHLTDDAEHPMGKGDLVVVPRGEWHGFRNTGTAPVKAIFGFLGVHSLETSGYELHPKTVEMIPKT